MDGLELLDADLGVNGRGFELLVTEELLDETDVGSNMWVAQVDRIKWHEPGRLMSACLSHLETIRLSTSGLKGSP